MATLGIDLDDIGLDAQDVHAGPVASAKPVVAAPDPSALTPGSPLAQALFQVWAGRSVVSVESPPGAGKPIHHDEPVLMSDGSSKPIGDIHVGDEVISHLGLARRVLAVHRQGVLPTLSILTAAGRTIRAAYDHPFLTPQGWVNASDLVQGQALAAISEPEELLHLESARTDGEFRLAGYLIGDGACSSGNMNVTTADMSVAADIAAIALTLGWGSRLVPPRRAIAKASKVTFFNPDGPKHSNGPHTWLRRSGLDGATAKTKRVPSWVFRAAPEQIAQFVGAYFSADGYVQPPHDPGRTKPRASMSSCRSGLLLDIQSLLLRLGVDSYIRRHDSTLNGKVFEAYDLNLRDWDDVARFAEKVPVVNVLRSSRLRAWGAKSQTFRSPFIPDPVVSVTPTDGGECVCLTVELDHTFIVRDIVVHNSTLICEAVEQLFRRSDMTITVATPTRRGAFEMAGRLAGVLGLTQSGEPRVAMGMSAKAGEDLPKDVRDHAKPSTLTREVVVRTIASCKAKPPEVDVLVVDEAYQAVFAQVAQAAEKATQIFMVGDPGQIGPVVQTDTTAWANMAAGPHMRAPEVFAQDSDAFVLRLPSTYRLGQVTADAIAPLYDFPFTSARPERYLTDKTGQRLPEITPMLVESTGEFDMELLSTVAQEAVKFIGMQVTEITPDGPVSRALDGSDIAVVVARSGQESAVNAMLRRQGAHTEDISVGTADRLQGGQWHAVVALDPLVGSDQVDDFRTGPGRLCVMCSRHSARMIFMHDGRWEESLNSDLADPEAAAKGLAVRRMLCAPPRGVARKVAA